eukprot:704564-Prorocentrum_lima.AAC.1
MGSLKKVSPPEEIFAMFDRIRQDMEKDEDVEKQGCVEDVEGFDPGLPSEVQHSQDSRGWLVAR